MFNQCILTTMTYGSETWSLTKDLEQKLVTSQRARCRIYLCEKKSITKSYARKQRLKTSWRRKSENQSGDGLGMYVARLQDNRWTNRLTEWQPGMGKRRRGRQKRR